MTVSSGDLVGLAHDLQLHRDFVTVDRRLLESIDTQEVQRREKEASRHCQDHRKGGAIVQVKDLATAQLVRIIHRLIDTVRCLPSAGRPHVYGRILCHLATGRRDVQEGITRREDVLAVTQRHD